MADTQDRPRTTTGSDTPEVKVYDNQTGTTGAMREESRPLATGTTSGMSTGSTSATRSGTNWGTIILWVLIVLAAILLIWWLL